MINAKMTKWVILKNAKKNPEDTRNVSNTDGV